MALLDMDRAGRVFGSGHLRVVALDDVSLRVSAGEFVAVMGPSGSGKSTLLRLAGGLDRPTSGRILLSGRDLAGLDEAGLAEALRREIGIVLQEANLLASLTAAENVALALELAGVRPKAAMAAARGLLDSLGLGAAGGRFPGQLSGGEQQRVAIARAVAGGRSLLLADEPTGALDALTGESVMSLLRQRCATGCAVILATHNVRHAAWADRVVFLADGRVDGETVRRPVRSACWEPGRYGDRHCGHPGHHRAGRSGEVLPQRPEWLGFRALGGVDLAIAAGEMVAITGPSGSGKTTIINLIAGIDRPSAGTVTVNGSRLDQMTEEQLAVWRGRTIGIVFQFFQLMPTLTAAENATLPLDLAHLGRPANARPPPATTWPRWGSVIAATGCRWSCPAGSSSASRSPGPWPANRRSCSATSSPATLTPSWPRTCSGCSRS